jgi:hypothetical protein
LFFSSFPQAPVPAGVDGAAAASQAAEVLAQAAAENVEVVLPLDFATLKTCQDPAETGEEIVVRSVDEISTMTANKGTFSLNFGSFCLKRGLLVV